MFLEMREINKDLKTHFKKLEDKFNLIATEEKENKPKVVLEHKIKEEIIDLINEYKQKSVYDSMLSSKLDTKKSVNFIWI